MIDKKFARRYVHVQMPIDMAKSLLSVNQGISNNGDLPLTSAESKGQGYKYWNES